MSGNGLPPLDLQSSDNWMLLLRGPTHAERAAWSTASTAKTAGVRSCFLPLPPAFISEAIEGAGDEDLLVGAGISAAALERTRPVHNDPPPLAAAGLVGGLGAADDEAFGAAEREVDGATAAPTAAPPGPATLLKREADVTDTNSCGVDA